MKVPFLIRFAPLALPLAALACSTTPPLDAAAGPYPQGDRAASPPTGEVSGEKYDQVVENDWVDAGQQPTSTFGADVDTASYSLMRRDVGAGRLPVEAGVRPEEYLNYFSYNYAQPEGDAPFAVHLDGAPSFFGENAHLVRVGLQGKTVDAAQRKRADLVFLVDVSGSMSAGNKLPLVQYTLKQLARRLGPADTLAIVTYAGSERVLIAPTPVVDRAKIDDAIDGLAAGGGTNGEGGIRKAYELAEAARRERGDDAERRVVLCTDGDFNVGATGDELVRLIEAERDKGVTLTALGFGSGNYNDRDMQKLADHGNGNYAYIDGPGEANRALGEKLVSTLQVIAKDVKVQVEFDPAAVRRYRLVGYENRVLANEDFADDTKDAGELGAGHSVTALYEVELAPAAAAGAGALATVRLRHKAPGGDESIETARTLAAGDLARSFDAAPADLRFAAAVAEYAEILRRSKHSAGARFDDVLALAGGAASERADRLEFLSLVEAAKPLWR